MSSYRYTPLSSKPNVTRLLRLLPSSDEHEALQCELFECGLRLSDSASQPYEALSYVWGEETDPRSIIVDNEDLSVTRNLHAVLLRLRDPDVPRILWIDAVSINQGDEKEKVQQIQLMAAIYAKATRVLVWLDEAENDGLDSAQALEWVRVAAETAKVPSNMWTVRPAVEKLLDRPWFQRIWVSKSQRRIVWSFSSLNRFCKK